MGETRKVDAQRPWAPVVGYSRAVRRGAVVEVSGTSATTLDGRVVAPNDAYEQAKYVLGQIVDALAELGARPEDVIRTRAYLTDIRDWEEAGRAHGEVFGGIEPACSFVEISGLMLPELVVEFEATALVDETGG
jgi:enamine deaminase RidA (YjgF/YER057c/UK114 family)